MPPGAATVVYASPERVRTLPIRLGSVTYTQQDRRFVMATVAVSGISRRFLGVVLPFLVGSCGELRSTGPGSISIDSDEMTWESADADLWDIVDVIEKDGIIWVLTPVDPLVHGFQRGAEVVTFGRLGEGPNELRSARALLDRGDAGQITIWDPASRLYRTFSTAGSLVSTRDAGSLGMGAVRGDIGLVTFGDALRVAATTKGTVRAEYRGAVSWGDDLWAARLARFDDEGGVEHVVDFMDLRGASHEERRASSILVPVPLWDVCPDGRIVLLDPIARYLYLVGSSWAERDSVFVPWEVKPISRSDRLGYLASRLEAELQGQGVSDSEIEAMLVGAEAESRDQFATSAPLGIDIKCSAGRVWIQEFDGAAHPLGLGWRWRMIAFAGSAPAYSEVVLPVGFRPYRISESQMLGVVTDSLGLQRVASIPVPSSLRSP